MDSAFAEISNPPSPSGMANTSSDALAESDDCVREVRRCIEVIRDKLNYDVPTSIATMRSLEKMFANIVEAPDEPKYRRIRLTNPKAARLLGAKGVQPLLVKAGWRAAVEQMEEIWIHDGSLPLLRTTRQILSSLAASDAAAHAASEIVRAQNLAKATKVKLDTLADIKADRESYMERNGKSNGAQSGHGGTHKAPIVNAIEFAPAVAADR
mmetsp:Transcript_50295/g.115407  ORF Transcript_50295/g.115407 Transcript_50295/m.115407 type:complete len:211 (+) Transcript_50295:101-733(+)